MSLPSAAIVLESVSKRYGSRTIIRDVSFTVGHGEIVGFLGPNGAGKTTTMRLIAGFTAATTGRVTVAGYDMATDNVEAARRIVGEEVGRFTVWRRSARLAPVIQELYGRGERAAEKVRGIVEELDRPTLALLYKTLHDALGFRIETVDIAIGKLGR